VSKHAPVCCVTRKGNGLQNDSRDREDKWIDSHRNIGIIMGDFNDPIWSDRPTPARTWQVRLRDRSLVDPPPWWELRSKVPARGLGWMPFSFLRVCGT